MPLSVNYALADLSVPFIYFFSKRKRVMIERGLTSMYRRGDGPLTKEIIKNTFRNSLYSTIEVLLYPKMTKDISEKIIDIKGLENLDKALKSGRGAVLLHGHFGNPHIIMPGIGYRGYKLNQLGSRNPPEKREGLFSRMYNNLRTTVYESKLKYKESLPVNFIYTDAFIRDVFRRLKDNEIIAIGIDGREGSKSVVIDFLGGKALFYTGAMKLILRAKPVVLPTFHVRNKRSHTIIIEKPMDLEITGDEEKDTCANLKKILNIFENYMHRYPEHYVMIFGLKQSIFVSGESAS